MSIKHQDIDVKYLLQQIQCRLSKAKNDKNRSALKKIYHTLETIDNAISFPCGDNKKVIRRTMSLSELMQEIDDESKQNNDKDGRKVRIPHVSREVAKDGNHPILGELYSTFKEIRKSSQDTTDNSIQGIIERMIEDVSTALDDYDNNRIVFEIGGKQYEDLMKWKKEVDERIFRYQLETGNMLEGGSPLSNCIMERLKIAATKGGDARRPYYGTVGGAYVYEFCPTTIGLITKVKNAQYKIDLTNYSRL
jgi:hypothetical protein